MVEFVFICINMSPTYPGQHAGRSDTQIFMWKETYSFPLAYPIFWRGVALASTSASFCTYHWILDWPPEQMRVLNAGSIMRLPWQKRQATLHSWKANWPQCRRS